MTDNVSKEPMLDMFVFETTQLVEQLENLVLDSERQNGSETLINEIFRIMHTIKGSAAAMLFLNISSLAHALEDVFFFLREDKPINVDYSMITDIVLESMDFIKAEVQKIENGQEADGDGDKLIESVRAFLFTLKETDHSNLNVKKENIDFPQDDGCINNNSLKRQFRAVIYFEDDCEMENVRAFVVVHRLEEIAEDIHHIPDDIVNDPDSMEYIRKNGFQITFKTDLEPEKVKLHLEETIYLKEFCLEMLVDNQNACEPEKKKEIVLDDSELNGQIAKKQIEPGKEAEQGTYKNQQSFISVSVAKMDKLMDLVGELVIAESMVTQNPDLKAQGMQLNNFYKSARQLNKITNELQDIIMSVRMVSLAVTFQKMNRILRDMCKRLNKDVHLQIVGEETEVDKNIIEHISDPLMHLIRNAIDHGIESPEERITQGKPGEGKILLEAKNAGGDVWITVQDDGKGLNRDQILQKAQQSGLTSKMKSELTDKEIYSFIMMPGFTTKETVTEYSGRGVGMDVVAKNIEDVGGSVIVDSKPGEGTTISIKIPLTLAIIDGMIVRVGNSTYTIPITAIKESFKIREVDLIRDPDNREMIMVRGNCYPVIRLDQLFQVKSMVERVESGIITMVESGSTCFCLVSEELLGEQQVVVKAMPKYIKSTKGISGCTLLGNGSISLILDIAGLAAMI